MGFDLAHMISSISKFILRSARNADNGGSEDNDSKDSQFESICSEFNQNKLMKKYQGYAQNEKFKVGLNGKTVYIFDNDENELARFQDAPYIYRGKFIPNTNTLVVKSTAGWLLFYDLDSLALIKKIRFSNIGSQDGNFAITQDGKYLYNIESPNCSTRTQLTKYDLGTLKPYWAEKIPISLDIPTLLRMSQLDLARTLTENIVKNGYFQDIATGRNAAFTTGRSSWGLLYLIFA